MVATVEKTGTGAWQEIATGAGDFVMTSKGDGVVWAIAASTPSFDSGHVLQKGIDKSGKLIVSEKLYVKAELSAVVYLTTDNPTA